MSEEDNIKESEDIYAKELLEKIKQIEFGLKYFINENQSLKNELQYYKKAYESRVNDFLKLQKKVGK